MLSAETGDLSLLEPHLRQWFGAHYPVLAAAVLPLGTAVRVLTALLKRRLRLRGNRVQRLACALATGIGVPFALASGMPRDGVSPGEMAGTLAFCLSVYLAAVGTDQTLKDKDRVSEPGSEPGSEPVSEPAPVLDRPAPRTRRPSRPRPDGGEGAA